MEITISFQDGPIEAEIRAGEDDDYEEVLEALSEFVDDYSAQSPTDTGKSASPDADGEEPSDDGGSEEEHEQADLGNSSDPSNEEITHISDIPDQSLYRMVKTGRVEDEQVEEVPRIITETDELGESSQKRILHGAIIILTVLDDLHGKDTLKTSELKDALSDSNISTENWNNLGQMNETDIYLNRRGRGSTATTELRPPGKAEAYQLISELMD